MLGVGGVRPFDRLGPGAGLLSGSRSWRGNPRPLIIPQSAALPDILVESLFALVRHKLLRMSRC
jgi:hypothetical protein